MFSATDIFPGTTPVYQRHVPAGDPRFSDTEEGGSDDDVASRFSDMGDDDEAIPAVRDVDMRPRWPASRLWTMGLLLLLPPRRLPPPPLTGLPAGTVGGATLIAAFTAGAGGAVGTDADPPRRR